MVDILPLSIYLLATYQPFATPLYITHKLLKCTSLLYGLDGTQIKLVNFEVNLVLRWYIVFFFFRQGLNISGVSPGVSRRAPGGRTLSQEDLESFGLSIEVSNEFGPQPQTPNQNQVQFSSNVQFSPAGGTSPAVRASGITAVKSKPAGLTQFNSNQFVTLSMSEPGNVSSHVSAHAQGQFNNSQSQNARVNTSNFNSQFSPPPSNSNNSKQPFQF